MCADTGMMAMVHAENGDVVAELTAKLLAEGNTGPEAHAYSRPPQVEGEATNRAIMIADMAGVPLYVVHTSCEEAHEAIRRARQAGKRVWGEPLIQHLTLDEREYFHPDWDHAARRVMSPPFRAKSHQDSLWAGLQSGSLSCVATDHCAFTTEQKRFGLKSFAQIPNGTGGLEDRLPMLWTHGVGTGRLTPNEFVAVTSTNIAKILSKYPAKLLEMFNCTVELADDARLVQRFAGGVRATAPQPRKNIRARVGRGRCLHHAIGRIDVTDFKNWSNQTNHFHPVAKFWRVSAQAVGSSVVCRRC